MKRALLPGVSIIGFCFSALAQQAFDSTSMFVFYRPEFLINADSSSLVRALPMQEYLDGRFPGSTELGRMGTAPIANFPLAMMSVMPAPRPRSASTAQTDGKDTKDTKTMPLEPGSNWYVGGEVGFMYGHVTGKFGGDAFSEYIVGGVGNDHVQINVGAGYQEFNGRVPRWRP